VLELAGSHLPNGVILVSEIRDRPCAEARASGQTPHNIRSIACLPSLPLPYDEERTMNAVVAGPALPEIDYEARLKELEAHPLFMRDLPDDVHANERLEALHSLIYDDTPDSVYHFPSLSFFLS